jgi:hypothetical protein
MRWIARPRLARSEVRPTCLLVLPRPASIQAQPEARAIVASVRLDKRQEAGQVGRMFQGFQFPKTILIWFEGHPGTARAGSFRPRGRLG